MKARLAHTLSILLPLYVCLNAGTCLGSAGDLNNPMADSCGVSLIVPNFVTVNDDDDQPVSHPQYEKWDMEHCPSAYEDDLREVKVSATAGSVGGYFSLTIIAGSEKITSVVNGTILWNDSWKYVSTSMPVSISVPAGTTFKASYWIEGNLNSSAFNDVQFEAEFHSLGGLGTDGKWYLPTSATSGVKSTTVVQTDIDLDSNNNEGTTFNIGSKQEDVIESSELSVDDWPRRPGKFVVINNGSTDGVPDWADGFNINPGDAEDDLLDIVEFVPCLIEKKSPYTNDCEIRFDYDAADPKSVSVTGKPATWLPEHPYEYFRNSASALRLWKYPAYIQRSKENVPLGSFIPIGQWIKWTDLSPGNYDVVKLYIEAVNASGAIGDLKIKITMRERGMECVDEVVVTSIEFVSEPITARGAPKVSNPAGLINGDTSAYFFCDIKPTNYPKQKIAWAAAGACEITSPSSHGDWISAGGKSNNSDYTLNIEIPGMYTPPPKFQGKSLSLKTIEIKCFILRMNDGSGALVTEANIDSLLPELNKIYQQAAIKFQRTYSVQYIDNTDWYTSLNSIGPDGQTANGSEYALMQSTYNAADGIEAEIYFINKFDGGYLGLNWNIQSAAAGISIACDPAQSGFLPVVVGHELGHALGLGTEDMKDVYHVVYETVGGNLIEKARYSEGYPARIALNPLDWNSPGEVSPRYYQEGKRQIDFIQTVLMHGYSGVGIYNYDIPLGTVHGLKSDGTEGSVNVGLESMLRSNREPQH